jgi:carbon-monoxide dehydrogenase iron sulfur subunit
LRNRIEIMAEKCSGCRTCQLVCSLTHSAGAFNPRWATIRVDIDRNPGVHTPVSAIDVPRVCRQCEPAPCAEACPANAFVRKDDGAAWSIDENSCTGCGACAESCPFEMIVFREETAMKCDFCQGDPACVRYCPTGALALA